MELIRIKASFKKQSLQNIVKVINSIMKGENMPNSLSDYELYFVHAFSNFFMYTKWNSAYTLSDSFSMNYISVSFVNKKFKRLMNTLIII